MTRGLEHGERGLERVLWIGGPPDSGKTSIADLLGRRHRLPVYRFDRHELAHFARADATRQPALCAAHPDRVGPEERWLGSPPEAMARAALATWTERARMAFADLREFPSGVTIIAEGPGFFPKIIAPLLADPRQAVWLIPTEAFKRASVERRGKLRGVPVSDPERAIENLVRRDLLLAEHVRAGVTERQLSWREIDGTESIAEVAAMVEAQFAPWLGTAGSP